MDTSLPPEAEPKASRFVGLPLKSLLQRTGLLLVLGLLLILALNVLLAPPAPAPDIQPPAQAGTNPAQPALLTHNFGPAAVYSIGLPLQGGGVIAVGDSDWPFDKQLELVWHGYGSSPLRDIAVRVFPLESAHPEVYQRWLNAAQERLRGDMGYEPEGELTAFMAGGREWHNLPLSRPRKQLDGREAVDVNLSQYGNDAISVTFYFDLPPAEGIVEQLIPQVLGSMASTLEQRPETQSTEINPPPGRL